MAACAQPCTLPLLHSCEDVCTVGFVSPLCVSVCVRAYVRTTLGENTGHLGEAPATEMPHLSIKLPTLSC